MADFFETTEHGDSGWRPAKSGHGVLFRMMWPLFFFAARRGKQAAFRAGGARAPGLPEGSALAGNAIPIRAPNIQPLPQIRPPPPERPSPRVTMSFIPADGRPLYESSYTCCLRFTFETQTIGLTLSRSRPL